MAGKDKHSGGLPTPGGLPRRARVIELPPDFPLTSDEVVTLLDAAVSRHRTGEPIFVEGDLADALTIRVPIGSLLALELQEIAIALNQLNRAKQHGYADVTFTFDRYRMVKKGWLTLKGPEDRGGGLQVGGARVKEF